MGFKLAIPVSQVAKNRGFQTAEAIFAVCEFI
jgi:hypothetical protein